jgi:hypothetical protein
MALERPHIGRKEAEADRTAAVAVIDEIYQRRQFLVPTVIDREQVRLVVIGGHQVEQHDADAERLVPRHPLPELLEAGEQKAGVARLVKIGFVPPAAEIADPRQMRA